MLRGRGEGEDLKKIILGMLSWRFSLMSQFDMMEKGNVLPDSKGNMKTPDYVRAKTKIQ